MNLSNILQIPGLNFPWKISRKIQEIYREVSHPLQPYLSFNKVFYANECLYLCVYRECLCGIRHLSVDAHYQRHDGLWSHYCKLFPSDLCLCERVFIHIMSIMKFTTITNSRVNFSTFLLRGGKITPCIIFHPDYSLGLLCKCLLLNTHSWKPRFPTF